MKKNEIKRKVESAKEAYLPQAIKEVAESQARGDVYDALNPRPEAASSLQDGPSPTTSRSTCIRPGDPRLG